MMNGMLINNQVKIKKQPRIMLNFRKDLQRKMGIINVAINSWSVQLTVRDQKTTFFFMIRD